MRGMRRITVLSAICCAVPAAAPAQVGAEFQSANHGAVLNLDGPVPASAIQVDGLLWATAAYAKTGGSVNSIHCSVAARNRGRLRQGMNVTLGGEILDGDGNELQTLSPKTKPFNPVAWFTWGFPDYSADQGAVVIRIAGGLSGGQQIDQITIICRSLNRRLCRSDGNTLCVVGNNRFKVQLDRGGGQGRVAARQLQSGLFTVTDPNQADVFVEVFNRCRLNNHFWVGIGSTTSAAFDVVVEDTVTGETRSFSNPGAFKAVVDASAFPDCP